MVPPEGNVGVVDDEPLFERAGRDPSLSLLVDRLLCLGRECLEEEEEEELPALEESESDEESEGDDLLCLGPLGE